MVSGPSPDAGDLAEYRAVLEADADGGLAGLYSTIVKRAHRRQLGTFFTPTAEVKFMLDLWDEIEESSPDVVIDVGAGVGVFTAEAAKRWPQAKVVAVDINPVTLGLLAVRLFSDSVTDSAKDFEARVTLVREDFTTWFVSGRAPEPGRRLVLGNPPYTRAQLLELAERERLHELTDGLCGSRASLSTVITALTLQRLAPSDGLSLLLPAQWLESQYARKLRSRLWNEQRRSVELRLVESEDLFGGAQVDAVALLVGAERDTPRPFRIGKWREPELEELDRTEPVPDSWRQAFDHSPMLEPQTILKEQFVLSDLAEVHRGVATGANATFVLDETVALGLPVDATRRVVTRLVDLPDDLDSAALSSASDRAIGWLLTATKLHVEQSAALRALIKNAEENEIHTRVLCQRRSDWFDLTAEVRCPDVIIGAMTQKRFKLVNNSIGATLTNNLYGITWMRTTTSKQRRDVLRWLRTDEGQQALTGVARRQGAGLIKLEPGGLRRLPLPSEIVSG
ncbi:XamI DNA methyltransferase [Subtercola lobariae]|uniref:XamI DNA methyltransferase n=1 Tax=Subtercola lobariae TaxID=1588641 RepID=A0A917B3Y7_9MICO|nr:XamI DNA methyltransferase [Subtercola lobariae]